MKLKHCHIAAAAMALLLGISSARAQENTPESAQAQAQPQDPAQPQVPAQPQAQTPGQTPGDAVPMTPGPGQNPQPAPVTPPISTQRYPVKLNDQDYTKGRSTFPMIFNPYIALRLPKPAEVNAPSVDQLITNGQLRLGVEDAVAMALQNNLDISIQRFVTYESETAVLAAKAGPGPVNPFGGSISFDPVLTSTFGWARTSFPVNNPFLSGVGATGRFATLTNQSTIGDVGFVQGFPTGTNLAVTLNNTRQSSTSGSNLFNPSVSSQLNVAFQQPLLNGFGFTPNLRLLRVARLNNKIADLAFQLQLITTVTAVKNQYYELIFAQEDVEVKKKSVELAGKLYNDNKRQVEIGTLAPIEVTRAEAQLASTRADLITSQTLALQDENLLKQLILRNVMDPKIVEVKIVPVDKPTSNVVVPAIRIQDAVAEAAEKRPEVRQALLDLDARKINSRASRNALLPSLNLNAQYGSQGMGGNLLTLVPAGRNIGVNPIVDANGMPILINGAQVFTSSAAFTPGPVVSGGLGDALSNVFNSNFPNYSVTLNLNIPIRNRSAQAANLNAMLLQQQSEANVQKVRNTVAVDVRNAQIALEQDRYAVEANVRARILAEQTLDAEQKKFQLGASTIFLVIQAQRDLATASSNEVRSIVNFVEAKVNFDRALGRTLEENRIDLTELRHDHIQRIPLIPGSSSGEMAGEPGKY